MPSDVAVYVQGHRGRDPENPDVLCTPVATDLLVTFLYFIVCLALLYTYNVLLFFVVHFRRHMVRQ